MNPAYKYPLIAFFALVVVGLGYLVYSNLPRDVTEKIEDVGGNLIAEGESTSVNDNNGADDDGSVVVIVADGNGTTAAPSQQAVALLAAAKKNLAATDLLRARKNAEAVLRQPDIVLFSKTWRQAADIISKVNSELFNSDAPAPEKARYEVKPGDNLVKISRAFNTTVDALIRGNKNLDNSDSTIFPGMVFKIYKGEWRIVVYKSAFALIIYDGPRLFKVYDIAIGKQGRTPVGTFVVKDKIREPAWTPPGKNIPYGHPDNVLGTRWLGIRPTGDTDRTLRGYGIHGTWEPESIGSAASQGCIRMLNSDVEELFDITPVGTPVTIKE